MARLDMQARIGVDGSRWDQFIQKMQSDVTRVARVAPRQLAAGFAGGVLGGIGVGALRSGISRSFETAREARASAATIKNAEAGQMWDLARREQSKDLGGELTGMVGTVGDLQRRARAYDQQAIRTLSMLGLDRTGMASPFAEAERLFAKQADPSTSPKIRGMIEQMFPATFNQRAQQFGPEFLRKVRTENRELQNRALDTQLHIDTSKRRVQYIGIEGGYAAAGHGVSWLTRGGQAVGGSEGYRSFINMASKVDPTGATELSKSIGEYMFQKAFKKMGDDINDIKKGILDE